MLEQGLSELSIVTLSKVPYWVWIVLTLAARRQVNGAAYPL